MSELIFDEESDDVGADIEAYCPKCKGDTAHTIITKYEDEIRRVQCSPCGDVHSYRKPRGEADEETPEPTNSKKKAVAKKPTWQEAIDKIGNKLQNVARPYSIRDTYDEGDWMTHPKFGYGIVTELYENKVEVTFEDERRVLLHNRPDLAAQMPAIASMPAPREDKRKKGRGKKGRLSAPVAPPPPKAAAPVVVEKGKKGAPAAKQPPAAAAKSAKPVVAKAKPAERAKAAVAKKGAAKGKPAAKPKQAQKAKPAAKAKAARASRAVRAARPARPVKKPAKAAKKR